jgi:GNAT superfamily N-acetyltransferase
MKPTENRDIILSRLRGDVLRHIVTLKMLGLHGAAVELRFAEDPGGWALLSLLPARVSEFDRQTYPDADLVVLVDGTSPSAKSALLAKAPPGRLVIKAYDAHVGRLAQERFHAKRVRSFISFTQPRGARAGARPEGVLESGELVPEIAAILANNAYGAEELACHFGAGARWFAVHDQGRPVSAGFVFRNYDTVWEIGGLFTSPSHRRRGLARRILTAALAHLEASGFVPRYQVRSDNAESAGLARSAGLEEFLRMDHFVTEPA